MAGAALWGRWSYLVCSCCCGIYCCCVCAQEDDDCEAVKKMTTAAEELEHMAEQMRCFVSLSGQGETTVIDQKTRERKRNDCRLALVLLLRQRHEDLSERWVTAIGQRVCGWLVLL